MVTAVFRRKKFFRWWPLVVFAAVLLTFCLVAGRVSAATSTGHMTKHASTSKHSSSSMTESKSMSKLSDKELRSWIGRWEGTAGPDGKDTPAELVWSPAVGGEWLEGHLRVWADKTKRIVSMDALMFVRPTEVAGTYKLDAVDNNGDVQTGKATVNGNSMEWSWDFDNGNHENLTTNYPFNGKVTYTGSINGKDGQTPPEEIRYSLSKK